MSNTLYNYKFFGHIIILFFLFYIQVTANSDLKNVKRQSVKYFTDRIFFIF